MMVDSLDAAIGEAGIVGCLGDAEVLESVTDQARRTDDAQVDCAAVLDALREFSLREGKVNPEAQTVVDFQRAFLDNIRRNGRLNELDLIARFKIDVLLHTRQLAFLFKDAGLAPQLMSRKKLHLASERARDCEVVGRIYARCTPSPSGAPVEAVAK